MGSAAENFSRKLRKLRRERDWTQEELAGEVGLHHNFIGMLERGERKPALGTLETLARVFDSEPFELLKAPEEPAS